MSSSQKLVLFVVVFLVSFTILAAGTSDPVGQALALVDHQPLSFERNKGQAAREFDYLARGRNYSVLVNRASATVLLPNKRNSNYSTGAVRIRLLDTAPGATTRVSEPLLTRTNYLIGNDPRHWNTNVPNYGRVAYQRIYPGVDVVYYGRDGELEFDFAVAPGADPQAIHLTLEGAEASVTNKGDVVMRANGMRITLLKPRLYQFAGSHKHSVEGHYSVDQRNRVSFVIGTYDKTKKLVIDPVLAYSMMIGGGWPDSGAAVAVDSAGYTYIAGSTISANFPVTPAAFDSTCGTDGVCNQYSKNGSHFRYQDIFVAKLTSRGTRVWVTYLGGSADDIASGIAVDGNGHAYVGGYTSSLDYPASPLGGAPPKQTPFAFVTKLNSVGSSIVYSVRFCSQCTAAGIVVNSAGEAFVAGGTSGSFLAISNAFQGTTRGGTDGFVAKLNAAGTSLLYATFLGGSLYDSVAALTVDSSGNAYVAGLTLSTDFPTTSGAYEPSPKITPSPSFFVTKLNSTGSNLVFSTYFTGPGPGGLAGIAIDAAGNSYVTGASSSRNSFPTTSGAYQQTHHSLFDAYVTKFDSTGSRLVYSTLLGGGANDFGASIVVDHGAAIVTGGTGSGDFPTTENAFQRVNRTNHGFTCFITKLNATGSALSYSSLLGGSNNSGCQSAALGPFGNLYVTGSTEDNDFPTTPGAFRTPVGQFGPANAFAAQITPLCALKTGNLSVTICKPGNGTLVASPVTIMAGTTDALPVKLIEIFVDGTKVYQANLAAIMVRWPMSTGLHRVTVRARDYVNQPFAASVNVSVGP